MRKHLLREDVASGPVAAREHWLDVATATAEITSEDPGYPIEGALLHDHDDGWRAATPGIQRLRLLFDEPKDVQRILIEFVEPNTPRTQEFVLRWSPDADGTEEILRQQWTFDPAGATREVERYEVCLRGVRVLELVINPDISGGGSVHASLQRLRVG